MKDVIEKVEVWETAYNTFRPHISLEALSPHEMWKKCQLTPCFSNLECLKIGGWRSIKWLQPDVTKT